MLTRFILFTVCATGPIPGATENALRDLSAYAGVYTAPPHHRLKIMVEGEVLRAEPDAGPPGTLAPLDRKGRFQVQEVDVEVQFLFDRTGRITGLAATAGGQTRKMRRLDEGVLERAAIRSLATDTEASANAKLFNGYRRSRRPDGTFAPETYAFGNGGFQDSGAIDDSAARTSFEEIARIVAPALSRQQYLAAPVDTQPDLLIMIYWGTTASEDHPAVRAEEAVDPTSHTFRNKINRQNARLLGFEEVLHATVPPGPGRQSLAIHDVVEDLEASRYWVALLAIDLKVLRETKEVRPLWSVRYNTRSRGHSFLAALPEMTGLAAHYFGRDSRGLVNPSLNRNLAEAEVEVGEAVVVPDQPSAPPPSGQK